MILPLEKQVVSLELSEKLMRLRSPQNSAFFWEVANFSGSKPYLRMAVEVRDSLWPRSCFDGLMSTSDFKKNYAAYTAAELGELLRKQWPESQLYKEWPIAMVWTEDETEANARTKCLIYLLEHDLIRPYEDNKRV